MLCVFEYCSLKVIENALNLSPGKPCSLVLSALESLWKQCKVLMLVLITIHSQICCCIICQNLRNCLEFLSPFTNHKCILFKWRVCFFHNFDDRVMYAIFSWIDLVSKWVVCVDFFIWLILWCLQIIVLRVYWRDPWCRRCFYWHCSQLFLAPTIPVVFYSWFMFLPLLTYR